MGSAFKDGVDAGLSDFKSYNSDLSGASVGADPDSFSSIVSIANRAADIASRMRSNFEHIGENLHDDQKNWSQPQRQRLLDGCDGMVAQAADLTGMANDALAAANALKNLGDPGDDDDKKSQVEAAQEKLQEVSGKVTDQIGIARNGAAASAT